MDWGDRGVSELVGGDAAGEFVAPKSLRTPFMRAEEGEAKRIGSKVDDCYPTRLHAQGP